MATKLTIWNMALGWLGTRSVASGEERTPEATACTLYYDSARRQSLRDYPWNFAQRRAWLAQVPLPVGYERQYRFAYALPADCLKALKVLPHGVNSGGARGRNTYLANGASGAGGASGANPSRFILAHDPLQGRSVLLTNAAEALLCYTADITDEGLFDDLFVQLLSRRLAALIIVPLLKNNRGKVEELEQLYRAAIPSAVEADAGEGAEEEAPDQWIAARGGN